MLNVETKLRRTENCRHVCLALLNIFSIKITRFQVEFIGQNRKINILEASHAFDVNQNTITQIDGHNDYFLSFFFFVTCCLLFASIKKLWKNNVTGNNLIIPQSTRPIIYQKNIADIELKLKFKEIFFYKNNIFSTFCLPYQFSSGNSSSTIMYMYIYAV